MFRLILSLLLLFFGLTGCCAGQKGVAVSSETAKALVKDPFSWDFGLIKEGAILRHEFVLKNESGKALSIKNVNTSCGCTVSNVRKYKLKPGESTFIDVQFNTKGYQGDVQQFVYVQTDSIDNPVYRFIIKAKVIK